jgi:hypothetical protein
MADSLGSAGNPFGYDQAGQIVSIPGQVSGITYNAAGQPLTTTYVNGVSAVPLRRRPPC